MKTSEIMSKLRSKFLWQNLAGMAALVLALLLAVVLGLGIYTHHGERIEVPDVRHHALADAERLLENLGMVVVVADTGYVKSLPPGAVLEQNPHKGQYVKAGRTVFLTINALDAPTLALPDIIDNSSLREAQAKLSSMGFKLSEPQYITGEKDWVYGVKCKGRSLAAGDRVSVEDEVTIVVGNGHRDADDPDLYFTDPEYDYPEDAFDVGGDIDEFEIVE